VTKSFSELSRTGLFLALRTLFRIAPLSQSARDRLRQHFSNAHSHWIPAAAKGKPPGSEQPRRLYICSDEAAVGYVAHQLEELPDPLPATLAAFYLPQFHVIPENDVWWGKGFTEWRNVTRALPQFEGHHQPKLPGELGFYDLRNVQVMREQARLAREYGISVFCFYFYWFGGKTLLETPLRNWLDDKTIDLKFCLCWANEKWTRTWDGRGSDVLIDQQHSPEDDIAFIEYVAEYMRDPRYLRVDGKPILQIYRPGLLPDAMETATRWREWCRRSGIGEIHLVYVQSFDQTDPKTLGFDGTIEFPPNLTNAACISSDLQLINTDFTGKVLDWREMAAHFIDGTRPNYLRYSCVNPSWDNQARRPGSGRTFLFSSPRGYRDWLKKAIRSTQAIHRETGPLVFINAWNEWAEGATLEPDKRLGYAYLHQTRRALRASTQCQDEGSTNTCVVIHAWHLDVFDEILIALSATEIQCRVLVTTSHEHADAVRQRMLRFRMLSEVLVVENRGRDILPFLYACEKLIDDGVEIVLKLHTKRSSHRSDGNNWRREMIESLIGGKRCALAIQAFKEDPRLGMIGPEGHILPITYYWGANQTAVASLVAQMGLKVIDTESDTFVSGSMFWARLSAFRPLLDAHLQPSFFDNEAGQIDGTLAHAIERVFTHSCKGVGLRVISTAEIGDSHSQAGSVYPYAHRAD
jgi:lipopolysaccharide biosynthesis protein